MMNKGGAIRPLESARQRRVQVGGFGREAARRLALV